MQNTTSQTGAAATAKNGRRYTFAALTEEQRREAIRVASNNGRQHCIGLEFTLTEDGRIACVIDVLTKHERAAEPANVRIVIQNESGQQVSPSCTLGEFLADNPELVVGPSDILQVIKARGRWVYDGGAGGVFYLVPAPTDETAAAVEEILRAATAWYGDNVPVKWLAVMPAMRAAPGLVDALRSTTEALDAQAAMRQPGWETQLIIVRQARTVLGQIGGAR